MASEPVTTESTSPLPEANTLTYANKISLDILVTIKTAQQQFGLRHDDYQRYRKYCTRRLTRLRKSLKFSHQQGARGQQTFLKRPVEAHMVTDARFVQLVLFRTERAWAYSMQLKQDMEIQTNNTRLLHHQLRRLDKAASYAQALQRISVRADEHTALEAEAYAADMLALVAQERERWEDALTHLSKASAIYSKLGVISGTETNKVCKEKEEAIDQRIRYCIKYLRKSQGQSQGAEITASTKELIDQYLKGHTDFLTKLDSVVSDKLSTSTSSDSVAQDEVVWKGKSVSIQNEKLKTILLVNTKKITKDLDTNTETSLESKVQLFEQLFGAYADATKLIKEEITNIQKMGKSQGKTKDPQELSLQSLQEYVTYLKLSASVRRHALLADEAARQAQDPLEPRKKHPDDMTRLYENVISGMRELESLQVAQDPSEAALFAGRLVLYQALKCYWLALSLATLQNMDKASALLDRAVVHTGAAAKAFASLPQANAERERLVNLTNDITAAQAKVRAKAFLATLQEKTPSSNTQDGSVLADKHLTDFPPNLEAIPCKPMLFDLALNDCTFPDLEARKKPQAQKSGFFGFWRS